jgi:hypothetical protein
MSSVAGLYHAGLYHAGLYHAGLYHAGLGLCNSYMSSKIKCKK